MGEKKDVSIDIIPFWFFTPLDNDNPQQPIATISGSGNATIITDSLPINTNGIVEYVGIDFLTANGSNDLVFNFLKDGTIISTMSKKYLFQSIPNMIPLKIGMGTKTKLEVIAYNNNTLTTHRCRMVVTGHYWYLKG